MNTRALLVSPLGFLIGLSLGALGGGGSILAVPALVYAAGQTPKEAAASSLVLVAVTSAIGLVSHWHAGRVRIGAGIVFGLAGVGGALLGSSLSKGVDSDLLMFLFSFVMVAAAVAMYRRSRPGHPMAHAQSKALRFDLATSVRVLAAGTVVGLLTGFFGVGGGFVIVPMLVLALGFSMPEAAGTSLLVIIINSVVALSTRLNSGNLDWGSVTPFVVASIFGVLMGSRLAGTHDPRVLQRWFVWLLVVVAGYTMVRSGAALLG